MKKILLVNMMTLIFLNVYPIFTLADGNLIKIAEEFVPPNAILVSPKEPVSTKSVQVYDFDQNGQEEMVITFEIKEKKQPSPSQFGAIVLRKENEGWKKVWQTKTQGVNLQYSGFADITGDGIKEYLFGVTKGASAGNNLYVLKWNNKTLVKIANVQYHKMEILNKNYVGIAVWQRFIADTCFVDVLKWNGQRLIHDEVLYPEYYPVIEKFHKDKISKMDAWFYWYTLADAQIKANLFEKATKSIQKGTALAKQVSSSPDDIKYFSRLFNQLSELMKIKKKTIKHTSDKPPSFEEMYTQIGYKPVNEAVKEFENHFKKELNLPLRLPPIPFTHQVGRFSEDREYDINDVLDLEFINDKTPENHFNIYVRPLKSKINFTDSGSHRVFKLNNGQDANYITERLFNILVFEKGN